MALVSTKALDQRADFAGPGSTAAFCIVRTVMNWQNVTSDPTWTSVTNWYWRSWEVCIGIIAACIPALRPGYRTVSAGMSSYLSRRASRKASTFALPDSENRMDPHSDRRPIAPKEAKALQQFTSPLEAATHAVSVEADSAKHYGAGDESFPMKSLPGDKRTVEQGIKKTTQIEIDIESQKSLALEDTQKREGGRNFV